MRVPTVEPSSDGPRPPVLWRHAAVGFGIAGAAATAPWLIPLSRMGLCWHSSPLAAAAVSSAAGGLLWRAFFRRREVPSLILGVAVGVFIATFCLLLGTVVIASLSVRPSAPLSAAALEAGLRLCPVSLALFGWLTLPVGGLVGALLAAHGRRRGLLR